MGQSLDLVPGFLKTGGKILSRYCCDIAAKVRSISAPKNDESAKFPARSIRNFEKIFTRGGEIVILVETCMNNEEIPVCSVSISKDLY